MDKTYIQSQHISLSEWFLNFLLKRIRIQYKKRRFPQDIPVSQKLQHNLTAFAEDHQKIVHEDSPSVLELLLDHKFFSLLDYLLQLELLVNPDWKDIFVSACEFQSKIPYRPKKYRCVRFRLVCRALEHGVDIHSTSNNLSSLENAVFANQLDMAKLLVRKGIPFDAQYLNSNIRRLNATLFEEYIYRYGFQYSTLNSVRQMIHWMLQSGASPRPNILEQMMLRNNLRSDIPEELLRVLRYCGLNVSVAKYLMLKSLRIQQKLVK